MKIIIHAGMGKTGSTTIQYTFSGLAQAVYTYAPTWGPKGAGTTKDHNHTFLQCFAPKHAKLRYLPLLEHADKSESQLRLLRDRQRQALTTALENNTKPAFLFSSEIIGSGYPQWIKNLAEYCRRFSDDIQLIAYVRSPAAFMQSAFQQSVKTRNDASTLPLMVWPGYRHRFQRLDECFGRDNVRLKHFNRSQLSGGDVALDFAAQLGVPLTKQQVIHKNEGITREAVALLYTFKTLLPPRKPNPCRATKRQAFAQRLAGIGDGKLQFAPAVVAPVLKKHRADLDWIAARLGERIEDLPEPANGQIASLAELHDIALQQTEAVEQLATVTAPTGSSRQQRLLFALCALYDRE